jgi:GNAT superfamily N-acetyltransferase
MASESPKIERVKLKDLPAMAARFIDGAKPGTFIPITKHRAEAMVHNPNAEPDDVAMLLATVGERCVGYFGVMAVMLQHEGKLHKVHWLTTWAVAPDFIGKGLGSRLMEEALALEVDLAIVGSKPARRVSAKYGFQEVKPLDYVQIDFGVAGRYNPISLLLRLIRKLFSLMRIKLNIESISRPFEQLFELLFGWLFRPIVTWLVRQKVADMKTERIVQIDVVQARSTTGFARDHSVINWMLREPWVLPGQKSESKTLNYAFSDWRNEFETFAWKVSPDSGLDFACFQQSEIRARKILKVLDFQLAADALLAVALKRAAETRIDVIEGPAELVAPLGNGILGRLLVQRKQRTLQVHPRSADSPLGRAWQQLEQTYVDGDTAFT